jgi:hypothetical protein
MDNYIVVIGDIVHSKRLHNDLRKKTQESLEAVFSNIENESNALASPYIITLGDEFQAVYKSADDLFKHIWMIFAETRPVLVRISIGVSEISTKINTRHSLAMDGPAFHKAREQIDFMKQKKHLLAISSDYERFNRLINSTFQIMETNFRTWNKNRFSVLHKYHSGSDVKQIAAEIGMSDVAVYKNINAGALDAVVELTNTVSETINEML